MKYKILATMEYEAKVDIEADSYEEALKEAGDMVGDGILLRDADLKDFSVE